MDQSAENKHYVVGIAGGSASGKTSFLRQLKEQLPEGSVAIVSQDNYYKPKIEQEKDENGEVNFDLPTSIDKDAFEADLIKLIAGEAIEQTEYTFNDNRKEPKIVRVKSAPIIVVEGLFVFHYPEIRKLLDLRVYLDVREEIKLLRRIKRDAEERGYPEKTVRYQWDNHVTPSFKKFLKPYRDDSNIIITNNINYGKGLLVLKEHLLYRLEKVLTSSSKTAGSIA